MAVEKLRQPRVYFSLYLRFTDENFTSIYYCNGISSYISRLCCKKRRLLSRLCSVRQEKIHRVYTYIYIYRKGVLLKNLERTILIKCSLHIERNIYAYTCTPFGGYTFNLGDYKFRNEVHQWKKWNEKNWITPAGNRRESISPRESRDEVVAVRFLALLATTMKAQR